MAISVKICGVRTPEIGLAAARAGADYIGVVFVKSSPRAMDPDAAPAFARDLRAACAKADVAAPKTVALHVDPDPAALAATAPFVDAVQLHGAETPGEVAAVRRAYGLPTIKAIGVAGRDDVARAGSFDADVILFDAPKGGSGAGFDWNHLAAYDGDAPFFLAGGLSPATVGAAVAAARAHPKFAGVDVSSGVERARGEKDAGLIADFVAAARAA
ncbi:MAG: N-(5'-phosphoribosyl)anthranilate isomerase [Parvularculaceae bacterium]